jgi:AcrR family transcriptional regulator
MPRPRQVSDDEVLEAVRRAVLELGPQVSIDHVAERLGITGPALFRRFGSRERMLVAALAPADPPFLRQLEAGPDDRPVFDQLVEIFDEIGRWVASSLPCVTALRESGITFEQLGWDEDPPPLKMALALRGWLERAHRRGLLHMESADVVATAMLGAIQAPVFLRHVVKSTVSSSETAAFAENFARLFLRGIAPDPLVAASHKRPKERS